MYPRELEVLAMLDDLRAALEPAKFAELEASVLRSLRIAQCPGPDGEAERLRLDLMIRIGEVDEEQLIRLSWVVGDLLERRPLNDTNREG